MIELPTAAVLSTRRNAPGEFDDTSLSDDVRVEFPPSGYFCGDGPHAIFIHGFNNPYWEARFKYAAFRLLLELQGARPTHELIEFHWPGNAHLGFLSAVSYPAEIRPAIESGKKLARWIQTQASPKSTFLIIAHSLGGRVALEMLNELRASGGVERVVAACLMAAAVRCDRVESLYQVGEGHLPQPSWKILYSHNDWVMGTIFPLGQTLAFDGFFPSGVGATGEPASAWGPNVEENTAYGHSDYWFGGDAWKLPAADSPFRNQLRTAPIHPHDIPMQATGDLHSVSAVARMMGAATPGVISRRNMPTADSIVLRSCATRSLPFAQLAS